MPPKPAALALFGLAGCASPAWVVVSDLHGDKVFVADLARGREAWRVDVDDALPDACKVADDEGRFCLVYQSRHRVDADGHDEIVFAVTPAGGDDPYDPHNVAQIHGVRATDPPEWRWSVDRLDFSQVDPDGALCARDPADPCAPAPGLDADAARRCQLYWPHDFDVLGEDEDGLSLIVADTRNRRVLWLDAPREEGACAVVTEVLGEGHPDWDVYASVNSLDFWEEGGTRHLLLTVKDTSPGGEQDGGDGRGKVVRFEDPGEGWVQRWEFPPRSTEGPSFVNAPHGVAHDDAFVYFAHSLGRSDAWNEGEGGSVGVLSLDGAYAFDAVLPDTTLLWPRDVTPLGDGRLALVDSGTKGAESAPAATRLYVVALGEDVAPSGLGGAWTADGADQAFRALDVRDAPDFGDGWVYYSAQPLGERGVELSGLR